MTKDEMRKEICQLIKKAAEIAPEKVFAESAEDALHTIVYGAGNMGRNFEQFAKNLLPELKVSYFLDRDADNKPEFLGYRVYKPDDTRLSTDFRRESIVVLALVLTQENSYDELKDQLRALGYTRFINPFGMVISHEARDLDDREVFEGNKCRILEAFDLLQDENSREVFLSILNAYTTLDCSLPILSPGMTQYVDVNVPFRNQYHTFVDCGAFIGDTLKELVKRHKVEQYFGFEPDMQSYERLLWQTDALRWKKQSVLLPLGVGEKMDFCGFVP